MESAAEWFKSSNPHFRGVSIAQIVERDAIAWIGQDETLTPDS